MPSNLFKRFSNSVSLSPEFSPPLCLFLNLRGARFRGAKSHCVRVRIQLEQGESLSQRTLRRRQFTQVPPWLECGCRVGVTAGFETPTFMGTSAGFLGPASPGAFVLMTSQR